MATWRYKISLLVFKNISLVREYFSTLEKKFCISMWPCNILYISDSKDQENKVNRVFIITLPLQKGKHFEKKGGSYSRCVEEILH